MEEGNNLRNDILTSLAIHQDGLKNSLTQVYEQVDQRVSRVEEMLKAQSDQVQASQLSQVGPLYKVRPLNQKRGSSPAYTHIVQSQPARSEGVRVRLNQYAATCRSGCHCACHKSKTSATPGLVDRVLGKLFVGYAGLPLLSPKCDSEQCEKGQVTHVNLEYWFPLGFFWSQIVRLQVGYQANIGPQLQLSTLRRIPDSAQCVNFALNGNIEGLKDLFKRGLASPRDVSRTRGYSILRVGLSFAESSQETKIHC